MGYYPSKNVKELALPVIPELIGTSLSIDEYKDLTGIDLREVLEIFPSDTIGIKYDGKIVLTSYLSTAQVLAEGTNIVVKVATPNYIDSQSYSSGTTDAILQISLKDDASINVLGLQFNISKDETLSIDNLTIELHIG